MSTLDVPAWASRRTPTATPVTAPDTSTPQPGTAKKSTPGAPAARRAGARPQASTGRVPLLARPLASYYLVLSSAGLLLALGLVMVLSASSVNAFRVSGSSYSVFLKQVMWACIGLPLLLVASRMPVRSIRRLAYPLLLASVFGLMLVLVPGIGKSVLGSARWIGVGPFTIQPSELAKLGLVLWGADLLVRKRRRLAEWRHLLVPIVPVGTLIFGLVMLEPDMGTTLVLVIILLALLWVVGSPLRLFSGLLATLVLLATALAVTEPYRLARLTSFTDPFSNAQEGGYQAVQGVYALASGGWWGLGLGASREKWQYLPNAHTDFILAVTGEELGLVGTLLVLALFGVLAYAGIRVAQRSADPFGRLAAAGITAWLIGQAFINIGAVVGLVPITGIPLPFISFGGSSLVPTMIAIGFLLSLARTEPAAAQVLARRAARRSARRAPRRTESLLRGYRGGGGQPAGERLGLRRGARAVTRRRAPGREARAAGARKAGARTMSARRLSGRRPRRAGR